MRSPVPILILLLAAAPAAAQPLPDDWRQDDPFPRPRPLAAAAQQCDAVLRWNEEALRAIRADRTPPPVAARNLAVLHVALYDAVAGADGSYRAFRTGLPTPGADTQAAASVAAHRVLIELYPARVDELDTALDDTLGNVPEGPAKVRGIALGQVVAERTLRWRSGDARAARSDYAPRPGLGRWQPTPPGYARPVLPGWGSVPCFALADTAAFRPPGPPDVTSEAFAASYREVRALGAANSAVRTREQTQVALFWADGEGTVTPPGHWNRIAQAVAVDRNLTLAEKARLFAALNVAMADAAVVCWECKYRFDVWRPVTAIRSAGTGLGSDPDWAPLLPTPPFPAYTSGHSSFSAAAAAALAAVLGTDEVRFSTTSEGLPGVTRSFASFSAAAEEAGMSRIYGGIHWSFDNTDGLKCGRDVGGYVAMYFFRPRVEIAAGRGVPTVSESRRQR
jgi:hypothetical protein